MTLQEQAQKQEQTGIDVGAYAAGVGHIAAARLFALLQQSPKPVDHLWWIGGEPEEGEIPDDDAINNQVGDMANYCIRQEAFSGERLFNWLAVTGVISGAWDDTHQTTTMAYNVFVASVEAVSKPLLAIKAAEASKARQQHYAGLSKKDSIFQENDGLGDMDPARVAALEATAKNKAEADTTGDDDGAVAIAPNHSIVAIRDLTAKPGEEDPNVQAATKELTDKGAAWFRFTVNPEKTKVLIEGWDVRPAKESEFPIWPEDMVEALTLGAVDETAGAGAGPETVGEPDPNAPVASDLQLTVNIFPLTAAQAKKEITAARKTLKGAGGTYIRRTNAEREEGGKISLVLLEAWGVKPANLAEPVWPDAPPVNALPDTASNAGDGQDSGGDTTKA